MRVEDDEQLAELTEAVEDLYYFEFVFGEAVCGTAVVCVCAQACVCVCVRACMRTCVCTHVVGCIRMLVGV